MPLSYFNSQRKLGVEEWLVSAVMSMYSGAKTVVSTVYGNSKGFEVKVGTHQGSASSPLLFVIVMEAIYLENLGLPCHGNCCMLMSWQLWLKLKRSWVKDLMNGKIAWVVKAWESIWIKTKVMISGARQKVRQKAVRWPCVVCSKGVGGNSLQCTSCQKWVHKKCSGIKC